MERTKLYKLIIAALVIINAGILIFFLAGKRPHHQAMSGNIVEKIGIEDASKEVVTKLEKEHHQKKQALMKTDRELHHDLFSKLGTEADVSEIQAKIEVNHAEIEKMTYSFFNEVSKHCNAEQKVELRKIIRRVYRQMRKPPKK